MILNYPEDKICDFVNLSQPLDGPHTDPSMVRPTGPNQIVNRMQNPAGKTLISDIKNKYLLSSQTSGILCGD